MSISRKFRVKQWLVEVFAASEEDLEAGVITRYQVVNDQAVPGVNEAFISVDSGGYGQPLSYIERELALALPDGVRFLNAAGMDISDEVRKQNVGGILTEDGLRTSICGALLKGDRMQLNEDGSYQIGSKVYWLVGLFWKDKNRTYNFDGFFSKNPPSDGVVHVRELADLGVLFFKP